MKYFYIDNDGGTFGIRTTGGGDVSPRTGTFASMAAADVYGSIEDAHADPAHVAGDIFIISTSHQQSGTVGWIFVGKNSGPYTWHIVCDDLDCAKPTIAPNPILLHTTGNPSTSYNGRFFLWGFYNQSRGSCVAVNENDHVLCVDCKFVTSNSGTQIFRATSDGSSITAINCEYDTTVASGVPAWLYIGKGATINVHGGKFLSSNMTKVFNAASMFTAGGGHAYIEGIDLEFMTGDYGPIAGEATANEDGIDIVFRNVTLDSAVTQSRLQPENFIQPNQRIRYFNCSGNDAHAKYQFYDGGYGAYAEEDVATYRDDTQGFGTDNQKLSIKIDASLEASVDRATPFVTDLPSRFCALSVAATDTGRMFLTCDDALTHADIEFELIYPDKTNYRIPVMLTTLEQDPFSAGTALDTDGSSTWTGGKTNKYQVDLDTSGVPGADSVPLVRCRVYKQSVIYIDPVMRMVP